MTVTCGRHRLQSFMFLAKRIALAISVASAKTFLWVTPIFDKEPIYYMTVHQFW